VCLCVSLSVCVLFSVYRIVLYVCIVLCVCVYCSKYYSFILMYLVGHVGS